MRQSHQNIYKKKQRPLILEWSMLSMSYHIELLGFWEADMYVSPYEQFETTTPFTVIGHTGVIKIYDLIIAFEITAFYWYWYFCNSHIDLWSYYQNTTCDHIIRITKSPSIRRVSTLLRHNYHTKLCFMPRISFMSLGLRLVDKNWDIVKRSFLNPDQTLATHGMLLQNMAYRFSVAWEINRRGKSNWLHSITSDAVILILMSQFKRIIYAVWKKCNKKRSKILWKKHKTYQRLLVRRNDSTVLILELYLCIPEKRTLRVALN